ncbi:hypothetical protein GGI35DRAFT_82514 [Trichoderma velutinum]
MADSSMCDPSKLSEYAGITVPQINYSVPGVTVSLPCDVPFSLVIVGQKRPREELDTNDVAEPASKRPVTSMGLGDVNSQDIEMGDSGICRYPPSNFSSSAVDIFHAYGSKPPPISLDLGDTPGWGALTFMEGGSVYEYIKDSLCKESGGSYWYRTSSFSQQGPNEKLIRDMRLVPGKTFFHINPMITAQKEISSRFEEPIIELFARVVHTGCGVCSSESFQCFELEDFFPGQPYLSGLMRFEKRESPIYCESSPFLATTKADDKCYCLCQVVEDEKAALGWSLIIHDIQPVSWETIRSVYAGLGK